MKEKDAQREWLRDRLANAPRGTRAKLAKFLGFDRPDAITRMLNTDPGKESREIKAHEFARMQAFFADEAIRPPADADQARREHLLAMYDQLPPDAQALALTVLAALAHPKQQ